jgi:hypothetical protein
LGLRGRELAGGWRIWYNEELHDFFFTLTVIRVIILRRMRCAGNVVHVRDKRNANRVLVGKREGKRLFGRHSHRWEDNIEVDLNL